jgi:hypothetical protein
MGTPSLGSQRLVCYLHNPRTRPSGFFSVLFCLVYFSSLVSCLVSYAVALPWIRVTRWSRLHPFTAAFSLSYLHLLFSFCFFLSLEALLHWAVNVSLATFTTRAHDTQVSFPLSVSFSLIFLHLLFSNCFFLFLWALLHWAVNVSFATFTTRAHDHQVSSPLSLVFCASLLLCLVLSRMPLLNAVAALQREARRLHPFTAFCRRTLVDCTWATRFCVQ